MDEAEARRVLGVGPGAADDELRAAHRARIRWAHPDAGGTAAAAARVNRALEVLRAGPAPGAASTAPTPPPPPPASRVAAPPDDVDRYVVVEVGPAELLARLAEAGHEIGEVVYVDPHVGMLEIVVGTPPAVGQLAVTVGDEGEDGTPVAFTLDALGVTPAPPIHEVVGALLDALGGSAP